MNAPTRTPFRDADETRQMATILARGYVRFLAAKESPKELALPTESEAPCDHVVNAQENPESKEVST